MPHSGWTTRAPTANGSSPSRVGAHEPGATVVAVPARRLEGLAEVRQHELAPAGGRLGVAAHHVQPRAVELAAILLVLQRLLDRLVERRGAGGGGDVAAGQDLDRARVLQARDRGGELGLRQLGALLQLGRAERAGRGPDGLGDVAQLVGSDLPAAGEEAPQPKVLGPVEEDRVGGLAVAPRAPDLLVVRVDRLGDLGVEDEAHVGLVDAHAERGRRDDDVDPAVHEALLGGLALGCLHPGVVRDSVDARAAKRHGQRLGALARRGVDDARLGRRGHALEQRLVLVPRLVEALDGELDVRPVEAAHDDLRVAQPETRDDLVAHRRRRRGREREHGGVAERLDRGAQPQVLGTEVVAPLGDGVGLVDHHQRRARGHELVEHLLVGELLRGQEQELERVLGELGQRLGALGRRDARVELGGAERAVAQMVDLVLLQGDERRDDERRAVGEQAGELVDRRLARAGREHRERVAPGEHGGGRLALAGAQGREAEHLARGPLDPPLHRLRRHRDGRALPGPRHGHARRGRVGALRSPGSGP